MMPTTLADLLKDSAYRLDQFKPAHIAALEAAVTVKTSAKTATPYVTCLVRGKPIKLTPEEAVRQLYLRVLHSELNYPLARMAVEYEVSFGREKKRADICIFDKDRTTAPYILVELKKPKLKDGKEQLKGYCNATGAPIGVWTNGQQISYYHRKDPNYFEDIPGIPSAHEKLSKALQVGVTQAFSKAQGLREASKREMADAERLLMRALGLDTWTPPDTLTYERPSREAFAAGRLDAQFFAPRVTTLLQRLGSDGLRIADVAPARRERFEPAGEGGFDYIEIGSLGADGTAQDEAVPMREAPSRATQHVRAGDVVTSTVRPIRRLSALISPEQDGAVCSSGFVVLEPQHISGEVLMTYLRLPLVCELMDLHTSATMYPAIAEADLLALPIPAIAPAVQAQVQSAVRQAAQARQHAARLLDAAKRAVEIAIEDSEAAALGHLESVA